VCQRVIKECSTLKKIIEVEGFEDGKEIKLWLEEQAKKYKLRWVFAYLDDGVIWGEVREGNLVLSSEVAPAISPLLRAETLWEIRLFGSAGELLVWREETLLAERNPWRARFIGDNAEIECADSCRYQECFDEEFIIWGTIGDEVKEKGFTRMIEGNQGLVHIVPLLGLQGKHLDKNKVPFHPLRLLVRHYLQDDKETGFIYVVTSRLCDLYARRNDHEN
jgi:CRISPR-associated protein (TIGR03984 family)